ncbi:MAG: MBL fold metallo-hydrolase [Acidobacteria bacterium]|nr:MBL fold metallo-hydrolase [Acidobacteriota bacterium]
MPDIRVTFLGAGDAFCAGGKHQAGYLVQTGETAFLLDCGATTLASLKREKIDTGSIDQVFLSHLHGDHFAGLPFLFLEYMFEAPRRRPLRIAGPPGTEGRVADLFAAMYRDVSKKPLPFRLEFTELLPEQSLTLDGVAITPFRVPHQETEISLGLGVGIDGRRILYSGDTGWTEDLLRHSEDTDLFICECCFFETRVPFHLDYPCLWENRERFGTNRLVLTHLGREVLSRQREIELELATDGLTVAI